MVGKGLGIRDLNTMADNAGRVAPWRATLSAFTPDWCAPGSASACATSAAAPSPHTPRRPPAPPALAAPANPVRSTPPYALAAPPGVECKLLLLLALCEMLAGLPLAAWGLGLSAVLLP